MTATSELVIKVETLQNVLIDRARGREVDDGEYVSLRSQLVSSPSVREKLPRFVRTCHNSFQFWTFIKQKYPSYAERESYLREEFGPLLWELEGRSSTPADAGISAVLQRFDADHVHREWQTALERRTDEPDGAITMARTLLESTCKHILDEADVTYNDDSDLPALYHLVALHLQLAPSQHTEKAIKQILGGVHSAVEGLGALRNRTGDAHGKGKQRLASDPLHAELAVNLAGAVATFLVQTWEARVRA